MKYAVSRFNTSIFLPYLNARYRRRFAGLVRTGWMLRGAAQQQQRCYLRWSLWHLKRQLWQANTTTTAAEVAEHALQGGGLCVWVGLGSVDGRIDHQPRAKYVVIILFLSLLLLLVVVWVWADGFRQLPGKYDRLINPWAGRELLSCKEEGGLCTVFRCQLTMLEVVCEFVLQTGGLLVKMRSGYVQFCYNVE